MIDTWWQLILVMLAGAVVVLIVGATAAMLIKEYKKADYVMDVFADAEREQKRVERDDKGKHGEGYGI